MELLAAGVVDGRGRQLLALLSQKNARESSIHDLRHRAFGHEARIVFEDLFAEVGAGRHLGPEDLGDFRFGGTQAIEITHAG